jgi:hypothetical protein
LAINFAVFRSWTSLTRSNALSLLPWADKTPQIANRQTVTTTAANVWKNLRLDIASLLSNHVRHGVDDSCHYQADVPYIGLTGPAKIPCPSSVGLNYHPWRIFVLWLKDSRFLPDWQ